MATTPASPSPQKKKLFSSTTTASFFSSFRPSSKSSPDSEPQQQEEQEQPQQHSRPHSFSFKKLLRYLRLVILILAFATLILDAITLSFEVNVMGLDLSDVATQAGLLLAPDILAVVMIMTLLIYPFLVKINQPVPYIEEPYDYSDDEYYDNNEDEQSERAESVRHGNNDDREEMDEEEVLEVIRATRRRIQQELALHQDPSSISRRDRRHHQQRRQQEQEQEQEQVRSLPTTSPVSAGPVRSSIPQEQEDEKVDAAAAATATAITVGEERAPSISPSTVKRRQRKRRNIYLVLRLICSFGLAALALYWPASNLKPPMGYLPGMDGYHHHRPPPPPPPPPPVTTGNSTGNGTFTGAEGNWVHNGTQTWNNSTVPIGRSGGKGYTGMGAGAGGDAGDGGGAGTGGPGHHGGYRSRWCQLEEAFGDNQSAIVYCQIKTIRPAMTYVWAILLIVELSIAFMAGDFSTSKASEDGEQALEMSVHQEREEILEDADMDGHVQHNSHSQNSESIPCVDDEASAGGMGEPAPLRPSNRRQRAARLGPSSDQGRTMG
ncbi:hypothetical protein EMPS_01527 [Entomortierella parvispora]|uniref:Uncharacterized protein n=1 Tax=Entomortierella parvispora TaxID=205924 RepID=A0A9P3H323_9FUNG|nr:hypothetical protein EMPS_01527 [Entomortierella parvispora]